MVELDTYFTELSDNSSRDDAIIFEKEPDSKIRLQLTGSIFRIIYSEYSIFELKIPVIPSSGTLCHTLLTLLKFSTIENDNDKMKLLIDNDSILIKLANIEIKIDVEYKVSKCINDKVQDIYEVITLIKDKKVIDVCDDYGNSYKMEIFCSLFNILCGNTNKNNIKKDNSHEYLENDL
jgi:hypothetical protein